MRIRASRFRTLVIEIGIGAVAGLGAALMWLAAAVASTSPANSASSALPTTAAIGKVANFGAEIVSPEVMQIAHWIADSSDNKSFYFFIIDKKNAAAHAFNAEAHLLASTPVLIGSANGDDSAAGIGSKPINQIRANERTTPAGRFLAERGRNTTGEDIIWIDYDAAVSMHRVRANVPAERRLERLATPTAADNRISYGCINVPVRFYETFIQPVFAAKRAMVYVLPDVKSLKDVFGFHPIDDHAPEQTIQKLP